MEGSKFVPSQIFFWSINCTDLVYKLGITFRKWTKIAYIGMDLVLTYIERLFSTVYYFSSYFHWSISCVRARKFHSFFLTRSETEARFKFEGFYFCYLWNVQFQLSSTFLAFCIWSVNYASQIFSQFFCQSVNCIRRVFDFGDLQKLKHWLVFETF